MKTSSRQKLRYLLTGSVISLLIVLSPLLFYAYQLFPNVPVWETDTFTFTSHYFQSVQVFFWTFLSKLTPVLLLMIWFATCKYWWHHAIVVPIAMMWFQIIGLFNDEIFYKDTIEKPYVAIIILVITFLLYVVRRGLAEKIGLKELDDEIENEINNI